MALAMLSGMALICGRWGWAARGRWYVGRLLKSADGGGKERKGFALSRSHTRKMIFLDL
jgi:hypothetical protein